MPDGLIDLKRHGKIIKQRKTNDFGCLRMVFGLFYFFFFHFHYLRDICTSITCNASDRIDYPNDIERFHHTKHTGI